MKNILLGTLKLQEDKETLKLQDSKGFLPLAKLGLPENFYGGRADNLAKTEQTGVYLVIEGKQVIDVIVDDPESLTKAQIAYLAETKFGVNIDTHDKKDEMIEQFTKLLSRA